MRVIKGTHSDPMARITDCAIYVVDCVPVFVADSDFSLPLLALLDQVQNKLGTPVPFEEILKVHLSCLVDRINAVQLNGRFRL